MVEHASDCAVHNAPAMDPGPGDCGAEVAAMVARILTVSETVSEMGAKSGTMLRSLAELFMSQQRQIEDRDALIKALRARVDNGDATA
jgi:hypothetical protein